MPNFIMSYLGSTLTPGEAGNQFWALIYIFIIFTGVSIAVIAMTWLERKTLAHSQLRFGPMSVGPHGLLHPIAGAIKLALKEEIIPAGANQFVFWIALMIGLLAAFTVYTVIPFGPSQAASDINIGVLFMLGVLSLGVHSIVVAGWAFKSRYPSRYPLIGALRSSAQALPYKVSMGLAIISAILMTSMNEKGTGTLSMIGIVQAQQHQGVWFIFKFFPLGLTAFAIFSIAMMMLAEIDRTPFDMAEANSEPTAGYHTEYSGLRWSLFLLAEYAAMIAVSSIAVTLWLGGWMRPFPNLLSAPAWDVVFSVFPTLTFFGLAAFTIVGVARMPSHSIMRRQRVALAAFAAALSLIALLLLAIAMAGRSPNGHFLAGLRDGIDYVYWFVLKVAVFMCLFIWYRATRPRYRFDRLMRIGWKVLLPISLVVLVATAIVGVIV